MEMRHIGSERTQKLKELKPNPDRREKTGGFLTQIAKFAIDSTINYSLKFKALAGRKQVYEIVQERLKDQPLSTSLDEKKKPLDVKLGMEEMQAKIEKMQEYTNIVKQQHEIVQERLKDQPLSTSLDEKKKPLDVKLGMEEMQAKIEKMQEYTNIVKQQHEISAKHAEGSAHPIKIPDESIHRSDLPQTNRKKIFIRSRL